MATDQAHPPVPSLDAAAFADAQASISAYYSLVFPNFTYFLQTLTSQSAGDAAPPLQSLHLLLQRRPRSMLIWAR